MELSNAWDLYYHLPNDNNWNLLSYKVIMKNIDNVETVNALNENIDDNINIAYQKYYAFCYAKWNNSIMGRPKK